MGFFSDLGSLVNDVKQIKDDVATTVNDTKQTVTDTAQQLNEEVVGLKDGFADVGQELRTNVADQANTIKDIVKPN